MFVQKEMVTTDGSQCNKIGVGYTAFRYESGKCEKLIGSCLLNQLEDIYQEDMNLLNNGTSPFCQFLIQQSSEFF